MSIRDYGPDLACPTHPTGQVMPTSRLTHWTPRLPQVSFPFPFPPFLLEERSLPTALLDIWKNSDSWEQVDSLSSAQILALHWRMTLAIQQQFLFLLCFTVAWAALRGSQWKDEQNLPLDGKRGLLGTSQEMKEGVYLSPPPPLPTNTCPGQPQRSEGRPC